MVLWDHVKVVRVQAAADLEAAKAAVRVKEIVKEIPALKQMINAVKAIL